jgi:lipoprotein-anchoring transpeptidase ErfK/SrfK
MRATWMVLGTLLVAGGVGYWKLRSSVPGAGATPPLERDTAPPKAEPPLIPAPPAPRAAAPVEPAALPPAEQRARELLRLMSEARAAQDLTRLAALETTLRAEVWDTVAARRHAVQSGMTLAQQAQALTGEARVKAQDKARRLISRGVFLAEVFDASGRATPDRERMLDTVRALNQQVLAYKPGLEGVTRPYVVPPGKVPVQIVQEEKLRTGHNALLQWNKGGNLDPRRLVAGETLLLPLGVLRVEVDVERRLMVLFLDEVFVKEFRVGVGTPATPTPRGLFEVGKKQENPDWYPPQGGKIRAGDPRNELGTVWIHITNSENPSGYGIHGTNKPESVGAACSQGCVRLSNSEASEVYWWVRTAAGGGEATKVLIR